MSKLYHKDVYWVHTFDKICNEMLESRNIKFTNHIEQRCKEKHIKLDYVQNVCNKLNILARNGLSFCYEIFEVESGKYIDKFALRIMYNKTQDLCLVFANDFDKETKTPYLALKTVWVNDRIDNHKTLDYSKYVQGKDE